MPTKPVVEKPVPLKPTILKREITASSRLFRVEELLLRFSNGVERVYERLVNRGHGSVLLVVITADKQFVLTREYNAGTDDYPWSVPKGGVDAGEDILTAANRELQEETGYRADELIPLKWLSANPGYMQHGIDVILARGLTESRLPGDEPEPIELKMWPIDKLSELVSGNDFHEGRAIAALYLAKGYLDNE